MSQYSDHWLMHYGMLRLVKQCQRLILAEFGERPALADPSLRLLLAEYAGRSRSRSLQALYGEIRLALIALEGPDVLVTDSPPAEDRAQRMYRGQPLEAAPSATRNEAAEGAANRPGKTIIYRGKTLQVA